MTRYKGRQSAKALETAKEALETWNFKAMNRKQRPKS
jgi:hypothetical protein